MLSGRCTAVVLMALVMPWPAHTEPALLPPTRATPAPIAPVPAPVPAVKPEPTAPTTEPATAPNASDTPASASTAAASPPPATPPASTPPAAGAAPDAVVPPVAKADAPADAETADDTADTAASGTLPKAAPEAAAAAPAGDKTTPAAGNNNAPDPSAPAPSGAKPALVAAKKLFGAVKEPAPLAARAIGAYSRGCLSGGKPLAVDGPTWQAMRLSRNRTWGHPELIKLLEKFAGEVKQDGWPGLLVGDLSQPRGGPMLTGHASHQLGLDADIWFTPMPDRRLSNKERESLSATSMLAGDNLSVDPKVWSESRVKIIKRVASYRKVERVLVHPAIKKALCDATPATANRAWLGKVRPYWGHFYHFHVRIGCPPGSPNCKPQAPIPGEDGCTKELDDWFKLLTRKPKPQPKPKDQIAKKPVKPARPVTLDDLPPDCRDVLAAGRDVKLTPPPIAASAAATPAKKSAAPVPAAGGAKLVPAAKKPKPATKAAAAKPSDKSKKQ